MNITSLGHAAIKVRDLDTSEAFYSGILGMHHLAFVVGNDPATLEAAARHLERHEVRYERVVHEEFESLYCRDPDGHLIELYCWPS